MNRLFAIESYKNCRLAFPDGDTIVAEGVGGQFLRVRFQRRIVGWRVALHVAISAPLITGDWYDLLCVQRPEEDHKTFWTQLRDQYFESSNRSRQAAMKSAAFVFDQLS